MITGNEPAFPLITGGGSIQDGMTTYVYLLAHSPVTWRDAQWNFNDSYKKNGSIAEIADHLAQMQCAAANALIKALNQPTQEG